MAEGSSKRGRKEQISQEDVYPVFQRYSATTVFTLLKEVNQVAADKKFDWNELVKKTATGITNAREYQMLWRHLAYHDTLEDKIDEGAVPLDDDSDTEFELEANPPVSGDSLTEATSCVKVLLASASLDANSGSAVEAPLTVNIPSGWSSDSASGKPQLQETKTTISVLVPKQPTSLPTVASSEGLDAMEAAGGNLPPRRRRKPWTKEEDEELLAAVQRNGEGNWANILKGEFKGDRTPSQLSQRWSILKKQKKNSNVGVGPLTADFSAVRKAFNMALDMPMVDSKLILQNGKGGSNSTTTTAPTSSQSQHQYRPDSESTTSLKSRLMNPMKPSTSPALSPDAMVKAAAFAAGARIATPSAAATLLKAAQSKNAVHIIPSGINSIKSSGPSTVNSLPPNVHFFGRGPVNRSTSGFNPLRPGVIPQTIRPSPPTAQMNAIQSANESNSSRENDQAEQVLKSVANVSISGANKNSNESIKNEANNNISDQAKGRSQEARSAVTGSGTHLQSEKKSNVENPRCLSPRKVVGKAGIFGTGAGKGSEKPEEKKITEVQVERERENKPKPEKEGSEMAEEKAETDM